MLKKAFLVFLSTLFFFTAPSNAAQKCAEDGIDNYYDQQTKFYDLNLACLLTLIDIRCAIEGGIFKNNKHLERGQPVASLVSIFEKKFKFDRLCPPSNLFRQFLSLALNEVSKRDEKKVVQSASKPDEKLNVLISKLVTVSSSRVTKNLSYGAIRSDDTLRTCFKYLYMDSSTPFVISMLIDYLSQNFEKNILSNLVAYACMRCDFHFCEGCRQWFGTSYELVKHLSFEAC